jgi:superfamily I DNA/RNA helicase
MPESKWLPADGLELEPAAINVVKSDTNTSVLAGPGAGKTELLAQRACYLLQTNKCLHPRRILAISFKRDAARNILERVKKRCGDELARRFTSLTYDAFAKRILDQFMHSLPIEFQPGPQYDVLTDYRELLHAFESLEQDVYNDNDRRQITRTFDNLNIPFNAHATSEMERAAINIQKAFLKGEEGLPCKLTFKTITKLSKHIILANEVIRKALRITYSHVFLDEFQDTTTLQYEFIKACFHDSESILTAVGDSKQRIMVWAGADKEVFDKFKSDFKAVENGLIMNHRSAPRLIQLQKLLAGQITGAEGGNVKSSDRWDEADGLCEIWNYEDPDDEAADLADNIEHWMTAERLKPRDIAVLVRQRPERYTDDLIAALKAKGVLGRNESYLQDLLSEDAVQVVLNLMYAMLNRKARQEWIDSIDLLKYFRGIISYDDSSDLQARMAERDLSDYLQVARSELINVSSKAELVSFLWKILEIFGIESFKNRFPQYRRGNYLNELMISTANHIWNEFEEYEDWLKAVQAFCGDLSIPIMTVHKSKGLEYDTVVFVGLEDSAIWNFANLQDEESCTLFVALSRAKRRVVFTFSNIRNTGFNDEPKRQSKNTLSPLYNLLRDSGIVTER